ncbi:hypothetical protein B0H17DRAFT_1144477 [Mycena rosella]|uniref:Uncharacterized protein n=1 Tax=Mycena rosella TaxID=1033263 RepID=A0AAD7G3C0_MYCRO|nr:hypothetical protein B0H17DRAFT_1144477 [Mycena rosella]
MGKFEMGRWAQELSTPYREPSRHHIVKDPEEYRWNFCREGGRKPAGTQKAAKARPDSQAAGRKTKTTRILEFDVNNALRYPERRARARQADARAPSRALPNNNRIKPKSRRRGGFRDGKPVRPATGNQRVCGSPAPNGLPKGGGAAGTAGVRISVIYAGGAGGGRGRDQLINRGNRSGRAGAIRESIAEEKASTRAPAARQQENGERTMDPAHRRPHYDPPLHIGNRFVTIAETGGGLKIWLRSAAPDVPWWKLNTVFQNTFQSLYHLVRMELGVILENQIYASPEMYNQSISDVSGGLIPGAMASRLSTTNTTLMADWRDTVRLFNETDRVPVMPYLRSVPRLKPLGSAITSVFVSTFAMLSVAWTILSLIAGAVTTSPAAQSTLEQGLGGQQRLMESASGFFRWGNPHLTFDLNPEWDASEASPFAPEEKHMLPPQTLIERLVVEKTSAAMSEMQLSLAEMQLSLAEMQHSLPSARGKIRFSCIPMRQWGVIDDGWDSKRKPAPQRSSVSDARAITHRGVGSRFFRVYIWFTCNAGGERRERDGLDEITETSQGTQCFEVVKTETRLSARPPQFPILTPSGHTWILHTRGMPTNFQTASEALSKPLE